MPSKFDEPFWIGDRYFSESDIAVMRETLRRFHRLRRGEMVATLCENLPWLTPKGEPRVAACRDLLDAIETAGWMPVPPKRPTARTARRDRQGTPLADVSVTTPLRELQPITVDPVPADELPIWNATMATYHPLGYQRAFGARQHYWIWAHGGSQPVRLGGLLFATAAHKLQARDRWIGWDAATRARFRPRIVNNSRYLLLPGVHVPHLASHVLGLVARRIRADWVARYGFAPILLETFVEEPWTGTCYAAANWHPLGLTTGRGRSAVSNRATLPRKSIWVYPLVRHWRTALVAPWPPMVPREETEE